MKYNIGDTVRITSEYKDVGTLPSDPATIALRIQYPDKTETNYTYALAEITRASEGFYYKDISITMAGIHTYRFTSTGTPALMEESNFLVVSNMF